MVVVLLAERAGPGPDPCLCVWLLRVGVVSGAGLVVVVGVLVVVEESGCGGCCDDDGALVLVRVHVSAPTSNTPTPDVV